MENELSTNDVEKLLDQMDHKLSNKPHVILTGGNPMISPAFWKILSLFSKNGYTYSVSTTPSERINVDSILKLASMGVKSISLSLDGTPQVHDHIRNKKGAFKNLVEIIPMIMDSGIKVQINTTIMKENVYLLPFIFKILRNLNVNVWEIFFLVKTGRGKFEESISPEESDQLLKYLVLVSKTGMEIRFVEAPEVNRVRIQTIEDNKSNGGDLFDELCLKTMELTGIDVRKLYTDFYQTEYRRAKTLFISSIGDIYPSGLFPLKLGNIRENSILGILDNNEILNNIQNSEVLTGYCKQCQFSKVCGGSRARAYCENGIWTGDDPLCSLVSKKNEGKSLPGIII